MLKNVLNNSIICVKINIMMNMINHNEQAIKYERDLISFARSKQLFKSVVYSYVFTKS